MLSCEGARPPRRRLPSHDEFVLRIHLRPLRFQRADLKRKVCASQRNHCSFFPMSVSVMEAFKNELKGFPTSKGTIRFPVDKPLAAALVKKLVKARIAENERKKRR